MPATLLLLSQIIVILLAARITGSVVERFGQPRVIGEMLAGVLLGPSLFGALAPELWHFLFAPGSLGFIRALSQIGLIFFMFLVGLELDLRQLRNQGRTAALVSNAGIVVPLALGVTLGTFLHPRMAPPGVALTAFALFIGVAMSVTAFPVLARMLTDRGLLRTRAGSVAIAAAAVDDVTAWCLLAIVIAVARNAEHAPSLRLMFVGTAIYAALMVTVVRAALPRLVSDAGGLRRGSMAGVLLLVLISAWITERLGIHAIFGAFLAGAIMPRDGRLIESLTERLHDLMVIIFLPLFFAVTGLRTSIVAIDAGTVGVLALIVVVAVAGKLGGAALAARVGGLPWRDALAVGLLMNTRGLMELVVLNVGLDIGVISPTVFAMFVIMALITTTMTMPLLSLIHPRIADEGQPPHKAVAA